MEKQYKMVQNVTTGEITQVELTAEEIAAKEMAYQAVLKQQADEIAAL